MDIEDCDFNFDKMMDRHRNNTSDFKRKQYDRFLNIKSAKKFRFVHNFAKHYRVSKKLGEGNFGVVKIGCHRRTGMPCAVKVIKKQ